jgi:hypothetical protein
MQKFVSGQERMTKTDSDGVVHAVGRKRSGGYTRALEKRLASTHKAKAIAK